MIPQGFQPQVSNHFRLGLRVRSDVIFKLVVLVQVLLGDEIVEFGEDDRNVLGDVREPGGVRLATLMSFLGSLTPLSPPSMQVSLTTPALRACNC